MNAETDQKMSLGLDSGACEWLATEVNVEELLNQLSPEELLHQLSPSTNPDENNMELQHTENLPPPDAVGVAIPENYSNPEMQQQPEMHQPQMQQSQMQQSQMQQSQMQQPQMQQPQMQQPQMQQPQLNYYNNGDNQIPAECNNLIHDQFDDCHKMQLRVSYQKLAIGKGGIHGHNMNSADGFVLFYNQTYANLPPSVEHFQLPPLRHGIKRGIQGQKDTELTMEVLKDLQKGLHIQYEHTDACIYATRYCKTRVFYWSTQHQDTQTIRLERKQKTKVFCIRTFIQTFYTNFNNGHKTKVPSIVFTFGQQWNSSSCDLRDMLVYAEVKLLTVVEKILSLSPNQAVMDSIHRSMTRADIQKSLESVL